MQESGYRALKKRLNGYHKFSFNLPPKGKKLTPQQKSAITRQAQKILPTIKRVEKDKASFIKKPKGVSLKNLPQELKTNKGIFYPTPGAKLEIKKKGKRLKSQLVIKYKKLYEKYFQFPQDILGNMELIEIFVADLEKKFKPEYIMMAINAFMGKVRYTPEAFNQYASGLMSNPKFKKDMDNARDENKDFYTGVFLGFRA